MQFSWDQLRDLCCAAILNAGGDALTADVLAEATVQAERRGRSDVGVSHLFDFLGHFRSGRANPEPEVSATAPRPGILVIDADEGIQHVAFEMYRDDFTDGARDNGVMMVGISNSYSGGELGYFSSGLAEDGFIAVVGTNSPAMVSVFGSREPVTGTNPMSFAIPGSPIPRVIDQASSVTAWVNVRAAAQEGRPIPESWATDPDGVPTTDAERGLVGALSPFGGHKGSNIAMLVEVLSMVVGANSSLQSQDTGDGSPGIGLWAIVIDPSAFPQGRLDDYFDSIEPLIGHDFGRRRPLAEAPDIPDELFARLCVEAGEVTDR